MSSKTKHVIELQKQGGGYFTIIVDGVKWGSVTLDQRGIYGSVYTLLNARSGRVMRDRKGQRPGKIEVTVWSDKQYLKNLGEGYRGADAIDRAKRDGLYKPLEARLIEATEAVIDSGDFKSPDAIDAEIQARADRLREAEEAAKAKRDAAFRAKAEEAINKLVGWNCPSIAPEDITTIVEAMEWAQSQ